jgi:hypothetical protein
MFRRILSALLALCFLGPSGAPLLAAAAQSDSMPGMACCRKTKHGCCKRKQHTKGAAWQAGPACGDKCAVTPLAFGGSKPAELPLSIAPVLAPRPHRVNAVEPVFVAVHRKTDLYQRPPPASF